jgi:hypothetical protein
MGRIGLSPVSKSVLVQLLVRRGAAPGGAAPLSGAASKHSASGGFLLLLEVVLLFVVSDKVKTLLLSGQTPWNRWRSQTIP